MINRIERGATVQTQDGTFGHVLQVIVDPDTKDLTHVVIRPVAGGDDLMIPADMVTEAGDNTVRLGTSTSALESRRDELRYNEADFQAVDPDEVEQPGSVPTRGGQVITGADSNRVELASGDGRTATDATFADVDPAEESADTKAEADLSTTPSRPQGTGLQRKGKELIGLPVMTFSEGRNIGKVKDILFDPEQNRVVALLIDEGGWFSSARVVPWQNIQMVGPDSIILPNSSAEIKADSDRYIKRIMQADNILTGTRVYTEDGRDLGTIGDMYIDDSTGHVAGYEVSGGVFASSLRGKKFMPAPETLTVGRDVAFVPSEVGDAMEAQTGGIVGAAQGASTATSGALSSARDKVSTATRDQQRAYVLDKPVNRDVTGDAGEVLVPAGKAVDQADVDRAEAAGKLNALFLATGGAAAGGVFDSLSARTDEMTGRMSAAATERRTQQLNSSIGRTVGRDVYADDGTAVALRGMVVDPMTVERARAYGKENQLLGAVGLASTQETMGQTRESISGALSGLKSRIDELTAQQREDRQRKRLNNALGRPVTRVILDEQDNIILDTAQIVTHQAIERARAAGVLDILLDSIYAIEPDLSPDVLHSGRSGQASLEANLEQQRKPQEPLS